MNKTELLQLGQMIRRTSQLTTMRKVAQAPMWQRFLPGAMAAAGGAGGYMAYDKANAASGDRLPWWGKWLATAGGAGLGLAAGGARIPWDPQTLERMYQFGRQSEVLPMVGGLGGALAGGVAGYRNSGDSDKGGYPWASTILGAGLGGAMGLTAGTGLNRAISRFSGNAARELATDRYGAQLASDWRNHQMGQSSGWWPSRMRRMLENDPNNLVGQSLVAERMRGMGADDIFAALSQRDPAAALTTRFSGPRINSWLNDTRPALNIGSALGVAPSAAQSVISNLTDLVGPDTMRYMRGAGLLGGGYVGANALANLYNKVNRPAEDERRRNRGVIVL